MAAREVISFPAIAIANELKKRKEVQGILFTGTPFGLESEIVPKHGYELRMIRVGGLIGKGLSTRLKTLVQLPQLTSKAPEYCAIFSLSVVIGFGAYASGPVIVAAWTRRVPVLLVESNAIPGFTNRIASRFASRVAVPFEDRAGVLSWKGCCYRRSRASFTGIEMSRRIVSQLEFFAAARVPLRSTIRSFQRSGRLAQLRDKLHVVHQTGKKDFERVKAEYEKHAPFFEVVPFIEDVENFYGQLRSACMPGRGSDAGRSDFAREAGDPGSTSDRDAQSPGTKRESLEETGAAKMILQNDFSSDVLLRELEINAIAPGKIRNYG